VEGFGLVNAEAMACGLPIIGTAHSGSADAIVDGVTGFRIQKDDFESLGRHLHRLGSDRDLLETLSQQAMQRSRRHHPSAVIDRIEQALFDAAGIRGTVEARRESACGAAS
jgi:glycosyltransferase involved in cell wall biosynthesis